MFVVVACICLVVLTEFSISQPNRFSPLMQSKLSDIDTAIALIQPELLLNYNLTIATQSRICDRDLNTLVDAALKNKLWALKVFDAWGKPFPAGFLTGNIIWTGNYDECINPLFQKYNNTFVQQSVDTQYCAVHSTLTQPVEVKTGVILGICLPASCNRQAIVMLLQSIYKVGNITKDHLHCSNDRVNEHNTHRMGTIAYIVIISLLIAIVLMGSTIDIIVLVYATIRTNNGYKYGEDYDLSDEGMKENASDVFSQKLVEILNKKMPLLMFISEFSAIRTVKRLLTIDKKEDKNTFMFLNGVRVLSLFWVIFGHSYSSGIYYAWNILDIQSARRNIAFQLINNASFAVDTFFLLSGFLTAVLFVRQVQKKNLSSRFMALYYIHRYLRLTPAFVLVMFFSIYLTPYLGRGPLYPIQQGFEPTKCRDGNWWTAFLYIGNFLKSDDLCLGITWYLYNDMQFHWIAPLALIPFVKGRKFIGYVMTIIFVFVSIGSTLGLLLYYPSLAGHQKGVATNTSEPIFFDTVYMAPWCRISPYAFGLLTGFIVINTGSHYRITAMIRIVGCLLSTVLAMTCIFSNYEDYILPFGLSRTSTIAYQTISRTAWSVSISWLVFLCSTNQGGIVNRLLSASFWTPLARLNYAAYLIHLTVIFITMFNQSNPVYYQAISCINSYISHLFFSYLAAFIVVIFFEAPFFTLEKRIFKR